MNGIDCAKALIKSYDKAGFKAPLICIVTSYHNKRLKEVAMENGINHVFSKPIQTP
eukprot:CAMPEP_0176344690 /NCGR_PEP_ID=MMETSP0126-20121128/4877_1 /TAXON_ID=141414 ORGANISM="Strombidinopsis acuminatum, Strain SPMC142" /NCGR_SAMPLE_ID=MMETSP0126 /ASSEMBLY_ACC=CAM_ASM_000229 /LENGTH=55 /DNA_ID=CAMNT_0017691253 /DNA_START=862 /DNA_END=1026 /DNA_ORIENTATION=-